MLKVSKTPSGKYRAHGTVGTKRIRKSLKTRNIKVARQLAVKIEEAEWTKQLDPNAKVLPFEVAALRYQLADGEKRFLDKLIIHFKGVDISTIKEGHIQDAARILYPGRAHGTWNRHVITPCQAVINHAAARGRCSRIKVARFKVELPIRKAADEKWLRKFMACAVPEIAALALFMFTTGSRISEALNVTFDAIDGRAVRMMTKTGPRTAYLTREMMLLLHGLEHGEKHLFRFRSRSSVYNHWYRICDEAGIERLPPHQAGRHAFATEMIVRRGMDVKTTAVLGGWKSPALLLARYTHSGNLVAALDAAFPPRTGPKLAKPRKTV